VTAETEEELIKKLNEWKDNVESKGMRVSMNKTTVMIRCGPQDSEAEAGGCKMAMWQFNSILHCKPKKQDTILYCQMLTIFLNSFS